MTLPKELKDAISQLPSAQKDKLIFRLLKKDLTLANQLLFEFVSTDSVEQRRNQLKERLKHYISRITKSYYSSGYLHMDVREMSGMINEHVSVTKDKYGEIYLNLWMITEVLEGNNQQITNASFDRSYKFSLAVINRAFKIMLLIRKLHKDYIVDFEDLLKKFGFLIGHNHHFMKIAIHNGLDVNWMIKLEIPDNLEDIHKDLKARGYLK